ncbi:MAG: hypothetical protein V9G29_15390 [Burkholderiaceae bacterium]
MAYLRHSFASFDDFAKAIELLRSSSFESRSNKRWSSKFVFPFGPDALYEDLEIDSKGKMSNDRRFFARTGELLYMMLTRAKRGAELGDLLAKRLFDREAPMNRLVRALQGRVAARRRFARSRAICPRLANPRFDQICEDWLSILAKDMPIYDALEHLIAISGLNMLLYFLERAKRSGRRRRSGRDRLRDRLQGAHQGPCALWRQLPAQPGLACQGGPRSRRVNPDGARGGSMPLRATSRRPNE